MQVPQLLTNCRVSYNDNNRSFDGLAVIEVDLSILFDSHWMPRGYNRVCNNLDMREGKLCNPDLRRVGAVQTRRFGKWDYRRSPGDEYYIVVTRTNFFLYDIRTDMSANLATLVNQGHEIQVRGKAFGALDRGSVPGVMRFETEDRNFLVEVIRTTFTDDARNLKKYGDFEVIDQKGKIAELRDLVAQSHDR